ncbi:MAG: hypothetical protein ACRD5L_15045 [Bryobacteraceae bacterium]
MGRTIPTFIQRIEETLQHWSKFRRALRREDQEPFDRVFQRVRFYTQAATYQCHNNTMEAILLCVAVDLEKRVAAMERAMQKAGVRDEVARVDSGSIPEPRGDDSVAVERRAETLPFD